MKENNLSPYFGGGEERSSDAAKKGLVYSKQI